MKRLLLAGAMLLASGATRAAELKQGLRAEYFDRLFALETFPIIAAGEAPDVARIDADINWDAGAGPLPNTQIVDHGFVRWTGKVRVPRDGTYTFWTHSDDGSRVFINGVPVVDNGGVHGPQEKSGAVELKAGDHDLRVEYFENDAGAVCRFGWAGPGIDKAPVPPAALFH